MLYISPDGNYGDSQGLTFVDTADFNNEDWLLIDETGDYDRIDAATDCAINRGSDIITYATFTETEKAEMIDTLEGAINLMLSVRLPGLAAQLGDIRDILNKENS